MAVRVAVAFTVVTLANVHVVAAGWFDSLAGEGGATLWNNPLVAVATTAFNNSPAGNSLSQAMDSVKTFPESLFENTQQVFSRIESAGNALIGVCDGPALVGIIKPRLKLDLISPSECLNDLKLEIAKKIVTMEKGFVNFDENKFYVEGYTPGDGNDWADSTVLFISFKFTDLEFSYEFTTRSSLGAFGSRRGSFAFKLEGTSSLTLRVRVPSQLKQVTAQAEKGTCFVTVRKVTFEPASNIVITDFGYNSLVQNNSKFGLTERAMRKMAKEPANIATLKRSVEATLKYVLEPVISDGKVFCDPKKLTVAEAPKCKHKH